jgi:hypothetical protein
MPLDVYRPLLHQKVLHRGANNGASEVIVQRTPGLAQMIAVFDAAVARCARALFVLAIVSIGSAVSAKSTSPTVAGPVCNQTPVTVQQLAKVSNTRDRNFQCLGVTVQGTALKALRIESHHLVERDDATVLDYVKVAEYPLSLIMSSQGAVLDRARGRKAIIVQGRMSPTGSDVELVASYLYNGLTGEYHSCRITLDRSPNAAWHLINRLNETVSRIIIETRSIPVLGTIGIANLDGVCTPT